MKEKIISSLEKATDLNKEEISQLIEIPPDPRLGDYAFPTFILAKSLKKSPHQIAQDIAQKIKPTKEIEKIQAVGQYINFFINKKSLVQTTLIQILKQKDKYGSQNIKEKVLIESPGPNTNKPLHVGHIRNIVLAQAIQKILSFSGNNAKIVDIVNDRGVHICKSMIAYKKFGKNNTPEKAKKKPDHFVGDYYVKFAQEAKKDKSLEEETQKCLKLWESGDKETRALWKKMNTWALKGLKETYDKFDLNIEKSYFESDTYEKGRKVVLDALKKGKVKKREDGAVLIDLGKPLGEKILLRPNRTTVYITQDIYLAKLRKKEHNFDRALYVVANEQDYHFKVLFKILKELGYDWAEKLYHLSYGMVHLESGKMKSREGNIIDADDLIDDMKKLALEEVHKRYKSLPQKEKEIRAKFIAFAAMRYYFLKIEKTKDFTFNPKAALAFEGNTGSYLLYAYARAKGILRKARYKSKKKYKIDNITEKEKQLISQLSNFPELVKNACQNLAPNLIANHAHQLAQAFNEFYHAEKVIGSENEQFKLALVDAFSQVLKNALSLLNIQTLEKM